MTGWPAALPGLGAGAAVLYLAFWCWAGPSAVKSAVKTLSVGALALAAWIAGAPGLLVAALAFGALGDFCLSRPGERAFLAGLIAFVLAHLAYVPLFLGVPGGSLAALASWRGVALVAFALFALWLARRLWSASGDLRVPVMGYVAIIMCMVGAALGAPRPLLWLGAGLFALSDSVLAAEMFLLSDDHPARRWTPYAIWACYWTAQALFLWAFLP